LLRGARVVYSLEVAGLVRFVAEEVRKLAEESQRAAASIGTLIGEIQAETARALETVETGTRRAEESAEIVDGARTAFEQIGAAVNEMQSRITAVSKSTEEIAAVAEESSSATEEVSASTEETSASAEQIAASAQELAGTAQTLQDMVGQFQT